ncbi:Uncharacterised protein [uncultured archaeon]|nr:Uncharacterised protein [uncultured archaeon]
MLRGTLRDIISLYLGIKILGMWIFHTPFSTSVGWAALALLLITVWFVLEKVGIM